MRITTHAVIAVPLVTISEGGRVETPVGAPYAELSSELGFELPSIVRIEALPLPEKKAEVVAVPFVRYERKESRNRRIPSARLPAPPQEAEPAASPLPKDVRATPMAAFFPNDGRIALPEEGYGPDFHLTVEAQLLQSAICARSQARFEVLDVILQQFYAGASQLFSAARRRTDFGGLTLAADGEASYVMRSEPLAEGPAPKRPARNGGATSSEEDHRRAAHARMHADLFRLAAGGRLVALETGFVDVVSAEVQREAVKNDADLHPLTVQTKKNPDGGFFTPERREEPTLAIILGSSEDVRDAWESSLEAFISARSEASRAWRAHAERVGKIRF